MLKSKAGPVVGGIVGLLALVGLAVKLVSPGAGGNALEKRVDEYAARERDETPEARHRDVPKRLDELQALQKDPRFADVSKGKQALIKQRASELQLYTDFAAKVAGVPDPKDVENENQLHGLKKQLEQVRIPADYRSEWDKTEAGRRYDTLLDDVKAIEIGAEDVRRGYRAAAEEGEDVLRNRNAPRLPQRAKAVLDKAAPLPSPGKDNDRRLPGSERLTYAVVFRFAAVAESIRAWEKVRDRLRPLAAE